MTAQAEAAIFDGLNDQARGWPPAWFDAVSRRHTQAWRGVDAQHIVSTMRLVDSLEEQTVLESLLEGSKPPMPLGAATKHYLLATPFRYRPRHPSRFRRAGAVGVWYGAESLQTASAEVAYWRWRFVTDSVGLLQEELLTEHTFFSARVSGPCIDLLADPWLQGRARWMQAVDHGASHELAGAARERQVQWLRYESGRDPGGACVTVLDLAALDQVDLAGIQTWHCRATAQAVRLIHGSERFEWTF